MVAVPILPSGFGLPPLVYLVGLSLAIVGTVAVLYHRRPPVTESTVAALAPWMVAGGALYALFQIEAIPSAVAPLFGSPAVYVTVGVVAGLVWAAVADRPGDGWETTTAPGVLALGGGALVLAVVVAAVAIAASRGGPRLLWPTTALVASVVVTAVVWPILRRVTDVEATGLVGLVTVFGHTLDGFSTAVGLDVLGFGEQTPLSRAIIEFGATLPTAEFIGAAWLFVLVKIALAAVVVALFSDYVAEEPTEGYLLLGLIAAVGLGPGAHNVVLFAVA